MPGRTPFGPGTMWRLRAWPRLICRKSSGVALGTVVAIAYLAGALDFLERSFQDARFRLASTPASGEIVVVAIDSESLAWLEVWPWPRRLYADVVERLIAAGARRIALDLDFSSASDPEDDARLATALAAAGPSRIALPIFRQLYRESDGASTAVDTAPLSRFQDGATLVHVDFQPDADGTVRSVRARYERQGRSVPALALWLDPERTAPERINIDFGIDPLSIPQLSFADVLEGTFDPQAVVGKHVIVGATANELRDIASVPRYRLLPGPIIHVLVYETLRHGRALREIRGWPVALWTILLTGVFGTVAACSTLRTASLTCGGRQPVADRAVRRVRRPLAAHRAAQGRDPQRDRP